MRAWRSLVVCILVCWYSQLGVADSPTLERVFPPGGQVGQTLAVDVKGKAPNGPVEFWCDQPGLTWKKLEGDGKYEVSIAPDAVPGTRWIRVHDSVGASDVRRFVVGSTTEMVESEPNNAPDSATRIDSYPVVINGALQARGDVDHFVCQLKKSDQLVVSLYAERQLASGFDGCLQIVDRKGNVLVQNLDERGLDPQIVWTAPNDGEWVIRLFGFPATPDSSIALAGNENYLYRLLVTTGAVVDGSLPLAVSSMAPTKLRPVGWNFPAAGDSPAGNLDVDIPQQEGATSTPKSLTVTFPDIAGSVDLPIVTLPIVTMPIVTESQPGESAGVAGESASEALKIEIPVSISGAIDRVGQKDRFEFVATKGAKLELNLESDRMGYPLDAVVEIEDVSSGKSLKREDDSNRKPDPTFSWTAPADGAYRVVVSDLNETASPLHLYRLTIQPETPRYVAVVSGERFEFKSDGALELPIKITRLHGFAEEITFRLAELPDGWTCDPVVSAAKGETAANVKLKITSSKTHNGPVRVEAVVQPEGDNASPTFFLSQTNQLPLIWITCTASS